MMDERSLPKTCTEGLLCHYLKTDGSAQYTFLRVGKDGGAAAVVDNSLAFSFEKNLHICASCNGLLLLSSVRESQLCYHVCNPITKQWVALPEPPTACRNIRSALAFDGHCYQVVRLFRNGELGEPANLDMEIFSSESGQWRKHRPIIMPPSPIPTELPRLSTPPLFSNGAIHWELGEYLLLYHVNDGYCKLIELPTCSKKESWKSMTFGQCLWESEGHVHYCYSDYEGIHTWVPLTEEDHNYYSYYYSYDRDRFKWRLTHTVMHQMLRSRHPEIFLRMCNISPYFSKWEPSYISPCAFVEDTKTMYLRLPGSVVSYNFKTQTMEVCTFTFPNINFYCCSYPLVYTNPGNSQISNLSSRLEKASIVNLPLGEAVTEERVVKL